MKTLLCFLALFSFAFASAEETLYFESATKEETTRIVLYLSEGEVSGYQSWEVPEAHGTRGSLEGTLGDDGILRLVHRYTIEGADQAEEVVYKLDESGLLIGEGELVEDRDMTAAGRRGATLCIDGLTESVHHVTGDPGHPMTEAETIAKFTRFATPALGAAGVDRAIAALLQDAPAEGLFDAR